MALSDWNWRLAGDPQDVPWDCAACSTAWAMRACGYPHSEWDVINGLGPQRISPTYGLLDASGAGLVTYLREQGIGAENNPDCSWQQIVDAGGYQPMVIGGRQWNHWCAVRVAGPAIGLPDLGQIALMNSAEGYMGVYQVLYDDDFSRLGPFSAVWFTSW